MSFSGFRYANLGAQEALQTQVAQQQLLQRLQENAQYQQALPAQTELLRRAFAQQNQGPQVALSPQGPGAAPPVAVSPQAAASSPAGGTSAGGAGPAMPSGSGVPSFGVPDYVRQLIQTASGMGGDARVNSLALQGALKTLQPEVSPYERYLMGMYATQSRANEGAANRQSREHIASEQIEGRKAVAEAHKIVKASPAMKPVNDPKFRALEDKVKAMQAVYVRDASQENFDRLSAASTELLNYASAGDSGQGNAAGSRPGTPVPVTPPGTSQAGAGMPTYQEYDTLKSGQQFTDPDGNIRVKP